MSESPLTNLRLVSYIQGSAEHQPQIISKILLGDFSDANMQSQVKNQSTGYPLNSNSSSEKEAEEKVVSNLSQIGLVTFHPQATFGIWLDQDKEQNLSLQQTGTESIRSIQQNPNQESDDEKNSNDFQALKLKMMEIELIAGTQIKVLREQLDKRCAENRQLLLKTKHSAELVTTGMNTDPDSNCEEIQALKEALIRHVRINKHLMTKINGGMNKENFQALINQVEL